MLVFFSPPGQESWRCLIGWTLSSWVSTKSFPPVMRTGSTSELVSMNIFCDWNHFLYCRRAVICMIAFYVEQLDFCFNLPLRGVNNTWFIILNLSLQHLQFATCISGGVLVLAPWLRSMVVARGTVYALPTTVWDQKMWLARCCRLLSSSRWLRRIPMGKWCYASASLTNLWTGSSILTWVHLSVFNVLKSLAIG